MTRYHLLSKTEKGSFESEEALRLTKPEMDDCGRKRQCESELNRFREMMW